MNELRCDRCGGAYWPTWGRVGAFNERICERCVAEEAAVDQPQLDAREAE